MTKSLLIATFLIICYVIHYGETIRCWSCSSDVIKECGEPFAPDIHNVPLTDCDASGGSPIYLQLQHRRTACKTVKTLINGNTVIRRGCAWKPVDDKSTSCPETQIADARNVVTAFCETCDYDGCNTFSSPTNTGGLVDTQNKTDTS